MKKANVHRDNMIRVAVLGIVVVASFGLAGVRVPLALLVGDASEFGGHSKGAVVVGLVGKSHNQLKKANAELDEATRCDSRNFADIRDAYEKVLAAHKKVGQDLRTAFALQYGGGGYDPSGPVEGLSPDQVDQIHPDGFYYSAVNGFVELGGRLEKILEDWKTGLKTDESDRYKEATAKARALVPYRKRVRNEY